MALANGTVFAIQDTATTGNVNGAGFNPANANFPTDLAATSANTASPVVTSATYSFVAGDVGAWIYIKTGTNWTPGWYQIASVSAGAATLSAAIGAAVLSFSVQGVTTYNTIVGCATTASPTAGTYGVDYSQQDTAKINAIADFAAVGASTTLTSVTAGFTPVMVGNFFHQTTTGTGAFGLVGWYEIVSYSNATTVVLDRTPNSGTASVNCTGYVGGAGRFNGLEATFLAMIPANSTIWVKKGSYTVSGAVAGTNANATNILPNFFVGYKAIRGDVCNGTDQPQLLGGSGNQITFGNNQSLKNIQVRSSLNGNTLTIGTAAAFINGKVINSNVGGGSAMGLNVGAGNCVCKDSELVCQSGVAASTNSTTLCQFIGNYIHDSVTGISANNGGITIIGNLFEANKTAAITQSSNGNVIMNNTVYGAATPLGIGINLTAANSNNNKIINNNLVGLATGISATGAAGNNLAQCNNFFGNTTDVTNWTKDSSDTALDPQFSAVSQFSGTTATSATTVLTDAAADFSTVADGFDYLHTISGTGVTVATFLITSHTTTTLTVNGTLGTSSAGNVVYFVTHGHNFAPGTNLKGIGAPNFTQATNSFDTSYPDIGAIQRQETSGSGGMIQSRVFTGQ